MWAVCCAPVVTIGAATTALYTVMWRISAGQDVRVIREFWDAMRTNWKVATAAWGIMLLVGLIAMWFSPTVGWDALVATTVCKAICAVGSLAAFIPIALSIVFRHRYGANETARGKACTAAAYLGLLLTGLASFVSIGFALLGLQDVAAGKDEQALAAASYAGHNTFLGTEVKAIYLNADGSLIFCKKGTESYDLIPEKLKDGADLNVTLYGNSKTLIDVKEVVKKDESKYKLPSIVDDTEGDAEGNADSGTNGSTTGEQAE